MFSAQNILVSDF